MARSKSRTNGQNPTLIASAALTSPRPAALMSEEPLTTQRA
jgi:hypothetical protein